MCEKNVTRWLSDHLGINIPNADYVRDFAILWNIYESRLFDKGFKIGKVEKLIEEVKYRLNDNDFGQIFKYFQDHYTQAGKINNQFFDKLNFRREDRRLFVQTTLLAPNPSKEDKILTSAIIVYRLRNNLFHGEKNVETIDRQKSNFDIANCFLMNMIG